MKAKTLLYLLLAAALTSCNGGDNGRTIDGTDTSNLNRNVSATQPELSRLEFPRVKTDGSSLVVIHRAGESYNNGLNFATEWDTELMSQRWSCYIMVQGYQKSGVTRRDYRIDKSRESTYLMDADMDESLYLDDDYFYGSGFDHGHICPSADRLYSTKANDQTFYLTNMQPQYNKFNAGLWAKMEERVRNFTPKASGDTLFVCKGGTIDTEENILQRVKGKLIVPKYFYMALLMKNSLGYRAIAFWAENQNKDLSSDISNLKNYCLSIDELESRTGIDFFCNLPDKTETEVEASYSLAAWGIAE